jgi:hypothetical protein
MSKFSKSSATLTLSVHEIPRSFVYKVKKMDKIDGPNADKSEWINLEFSWIQINQLEVPRTPDSLLSSRMDAQRNGSSG